MGGPSNKRRAFRGKNPLQPWPRALEQTVLAQPLEQGPGGKVIDSLAYFGRFVVQT